jgi:hypothetical protein
MNDAPMRLFWSIVTLKSRAYTLVIHLPEPAGNGVPRRIERISGIRRGRHGDNRSGLVFPIRRQWRIQLHLAVVWWL